ncbi:hypothetical protein FraQA3DRAFT_1391 [Frankia sp. QA3]|nr:hypothetical protein FraQA3DRAFT_1391 [Frankia sp. QA3]
MSVSTDTILRLDLYNREQVLAAPEPRLVRQASVSFGRPTVHPVRADQFTGLHKLRPDLHRKQFLLVQWPFDLEKLPANRRYESMTVDIEFDNEAVVALDILPPAYDAPGPSDDETVRIDVRGVGRPRLAWDLCPVDPACGLRPRSRVMLVILDLPADVVRLTGTLGAKAVVARRRLGRFDTTTAESQTPAPFELGIDGTFAILPSASSGSPV